MWMLNWTKRMHFRYEITAHTRVHENDKICSISGHILGYTNSGFENNIIDKWASRNTTL